VIASVTASPVGSATLTQEAMTSLALSLGDGSDGDSLAIGTLLSLVDVKAENARFATMHTVWDLQQC